MIRDCGLCGGGSQWWKPFGTWAWAVNHGLCMVHVRLFFFFELMRASAWWNLCCAFAFIIVRVRSLMTITVFMILSLCENVRLQMRCRSCTKWFEHVMESDKIIKVHSITSEQMGGARNRDIRTWRYSLTTNTQCQIFSRLNKKMSYLRMRFRYSASSFEFLRQSSSLSS